MLSQAQILSLIYEYTKAAGAFALIGGQVADIESEEGVYELSKEETLKYIHLNKTAVLFKLAVKMGAIIANATDEQKQEFDLFATNFGLAFQIYDDVMDVISTFDELGKTAGKDYNAQKLTYVSLYGLKNSIEKCLSLLKYCRGIIKKYESETFNSILDKIEKRLEVRENC